jgi:N-acetylneuraminic acid mutarotase
MGFLIHYTQHDFCKILVALCVLFMVSIQTEGKEAVKESNKEKSPYADLDVGITSIGGAVLDGYIYVYGGHTGEAHSYYMEAQSDQLLRQNLKSPGKWEKMESGPRLQGLALVAHDHKLYRIGGFSAKNKQGEESDLVSTPEVASFDSKTKTWTSLTPMPVARSSHDAVVIGDLVYVAGGWAMKGKDVDDPVWLSSMFVADLSKPVLKWEKLPDTPFQRRAIALGEADGKLYVIGGMQKKGGPCSKMDVYDPAKKTWSEGPAVIGKGMAAFGCSAFNVGNKLYMTTMNGSVQRLSPDGSHWEKVAKLKNARFFHRLLPLSSHELIAVGGASMGTGKILELDVVSVK